MGLAVTDFAQHRHFTTAAEEYRRLIQRTMNDDIQAHPTKAGQSYIADSTLWEKVPPFDYAVPSASWVLGNYRTSISLLLVWVLLTLGAVLGAARRLEV